MGLTIKRLAGGGLITNYLCTSRCGHCLYNCSPRRGRGYIDDSTARDLFRLMKSLGCSSIHIGGGEPLLDPDRLASILALAQAEAMSIQYVETNCAWFTTPESAAGLLQNLRENGLRTLLISISPFHNERIPLTKTLGAMQACRNTGINVFPWTADLLDDLNAFDPATTHSLDEYQARFGKNYLPRLPSRYWIHLGGRALETYRLLLPRKSAEQILRENPQGCAELSDTTHFHLDLHGNYVPGLCSGLAIQARDLGRELPDARYPLINTLHQAGVSGLEALARADYDFTPDPNGYINKCDLCNHIRRHLAATGHESNELAPGGYYNEQPYPREAP